MALQALARTDLEALLRTRKLDRTIQSPDVGQPRAVPEAPETRLATGLPLLDERLGGGLPRGQVSEITGPRSSGRTTLMVAAVAAATRRGELTALVDPLDTFDPPSAGASGVELEHLLWLRGEGTTMGAVGRGEPDKLERLLDRALKALNLVLQAGGFDLVVLDFAEVPAAAIRRLPFTTWFRLQRVIEGSRTVCLLLGPAPIARSAEGLSIELNRRGGEEHDPRPMLPAGRGLEPCGNGRWSERLFLGFDIQARIVRSRDAEDGRVGIAARAMKNEE